MGRAAPHESEQKRRRHIAAPPITQVRARTGAQPDLPLDRAPDGRPTSPPDWADRDARPLGAGAYRRRPPDPPNRNALGAPRPTGSGPNRAP